MTTNEHPRHYASLSDVGQDREVNEDACADFELEDAGVLLVVADGMGGHEHGEVASAIAVEAIGQIVQNSPAEDIAERLLNGFRVANQRILAEAERADAVGMGTTAVAAYVTGDKVYVANVGDSRLYHVRNGTIIWHTRDHTRVQRMVEMGILDAEDAKDHPDSNVVTRALGYREDADGAPIEPDVTEQPLTLEKGDSLVLCSDGLYDGLDDDEIAESLNARSVGEAVAELVDFANERGGHDNITVTVLHYGTEVGNPNNVVPKRKATERPAKRTTVADEPAPSRPSALAPDGEEPEDDGAPDAAPTVRTVSGSDAKDDERKRRLGVIFIFAAIAIIAIAVAIYFASGKKADRDGKNDMTPSRDGGPAGASAVPADARPRVDADYPEGSAPSNRAPGKAKPAGDDDDDNGAATAPGPGTPGFGVGGTGSNRSKPPPPAIDELEKN